MYFYNNPYFEYYNPAPRQTVKVPLKWGFSARVTLLPSQDVSVEIFFLGNRVAYQKLTYSGQEVVFQDAAYKIVIGASGRSIYARGEFKKASPRPKFGPITIFSW